MDRTDGSTDAPSTQAEADMHELGRRVAQHYGYQSVQLDDPADYA
jgi:coproporphyrinogen III oxidase-like Fe-S oxidoreductase